MTRIGRLEMRKDGLYVSVEYGLSTQGYAFKLSDETKDRIYSELMDGLEMTNEGGEYWTKKKNQIQHTINQIQ